MGEPIKYRGFDILQEYDEGDQSWFAERGIHDTLGYCDSLEEMKAAIDEFLLDEGGAEVPLDDSLAGRLPRWTTPSLDDSFHRNEMDID